MRQLLLLFLSLPLLACQLTAGKNDASLELPPPNSRLVLNRALTILPATAHVAMQGGRVTSGNDINRYHPYCRLEVQNVAEVPQTVNPGEFVIRRAYQESNTVQAGGLRYTAGRIGFFDGSPSYLIFRTVFVLSSPQQPEVRWMVCEQWGDPVMGRNLTLKEIRNALGEILTLSLASDST